MQRDKYLAAVACLENYRANREGIRALRRKLRHLALSSAPRELTATSYDGIAGCGFHKLTLESAMEMERVINDIADKTAAMQVVEDALVIVSMGRNAECFTDILIMRHVDGWSMVDIAERLGYASRQTVYYQYNKAIARFASALGL